VSSVLHAGSSGYVQKHAGHKSMDIAINVFGHFHAGANRAAVDRLDDNLKDKTT